MINLNSSLNISRLNTKDTKLFVGTNKETIDSLYINDEGVPVYQGYDLSTTGDGTVPYVSANVFNLFHQDKSGGHGGLPQTFNQELVNFMLE